MDMDMDVDIEEEAVEDIEDISIVGGGCLAKDGSRLDECPDGR